MAVRTTRTGLPARPRLLVPALAALALLLVAGGVGVSLYTDLLWFRGVGFSSVFTTVLRTRLLLFVGFGLLMAVVVGANITVAYRVRPPFRPMSLEQQNLERYRVAIEPYLLQLLLLACGVFGLFAGLSAAGRWQTWLLWRNRTDFGVTDPQFGRDVSYYAMTYPFLRFVLGFLFTAVILSLVAATVTHYLFGGLRLQTVGEKVSLAARAHLSVLVGVIVLLKAAAYYLDRYGLAFSTRGVVQGASYTDVNAVLPAKNILIGVAVICALLFFANIVVRNILLPAGALALLVLSAIVLGGLFPAYTQQFRVKPNEVNREAQYIGRNIQATRAAYGIADVKPTDYDPTAGSVAALADDTSTVPNARVLDPNVVAPTFENLQRLRSYFGINAPVDIDRYTVNGTVQDYVIAAREVVQSGLRPEQRNWLNEHLTYTHGNGVIAAAANAVNERGEPIFTVRNIPPVGPDGGPSPIPITQPRIYYGESSPNYSVVNTDIPEIDGPAGAADQATFRYGGTGGVPLSNGMRKLAYALKFREPNLLLSGSIRDTSRMMYIREPRDRVKKVAPFLQLDSDPYPAVVGGRILWIVDGYTTSAGYPYSQQKVFGDVVADSTTGNRRQPEQTVNYIRNSVKATVDAYTGQVTLYRFGPTDPVLETWDKAFGGIIKPQSEISPELRAHLRYPEDLFKVQRELLSQYHVQDPAAFYNEEDFWGVPPDPVQAVNEATNADAAATAPPAVGPAVTTAANLPDQPPFYALLQFPGQPEQQFSLSTSFVARGRTNLTAVAAVSSDPADYGKIRVLQLPRNQQIPGPGQIANQFLSAPEVADSLFVFRRNGNKLTFGNLLTLPAGGGLLYVQPVFVSASGGTSFPLLQRVLVNFGSQTISANTLQDALDTLFGTPQTGPQPSGPQPSGPPPSTGSGGPVSPEVAAAISAADQAFRDAQAAFGRGDYVGYGAAQQRLQAALAQLTALQGGTTSPAPGTSPTPGTPTPTPGPGSPTPGTAVPGGGTATPGPGPASAPAG